MSKKKQNRQAAGKPQANNNSNQGKSLFAPRSLITVGALTLTLVLLVVLMADAMSGQTDAPGQTVIDRGTDIQTDSASAAPRREIDPDVRRRQALEDLPPAPIDLDPPFIDFGDVERNTKHFQVVKIRNTSNETLSIFHTGSNCGCTTSHTDNTHLGPGETLDYEITMDSRNIPGPKQVAARITFEGYERVEIPVVANVLE